MLLIARHTHDEELSLSETALEIGFTRCRRAAALRSDHPCWSPSYLPSCYTVRTPKEAEASEQEHIASNAATNSTFPLSLLEQDHYDYGLRNLKAVLNMAGALKRADPTMNEEAILMRALR